VADRKYDVIEFIETRRQLLETLPGNAYPTNQTNILSVDLFGGSIFKKSRPTMSRRVELRLLRECGFPDQSLGGALLILSLPSAIGDPKGIRDFDFYPVGRDCSIKDE